MTLAQALAGTPEAAVTESVEPRETASDKPAKTTGAAAMGEPVSPLKPLVSQVPVLGSLSKATQRLIPSEFEVGSFPSSVAVSPIGNIAMAMQSLLPALGGARAAAEEVSKLARLLVDAVDELATGETAAR
jgi:hypothetical protein